MYYYKNEIIITKSAPLLLKKVYCTLEKCMTKTSRYGIRTGDVWFQDKARRAFSGVLI